ncbi:hypothetical protein [Stenotrophomonas maltophilia]|uniref:hypothetical protein n=1 Tax=Stenotrophomonas maltophilia TaxID=40324 RepID=UPI0015E015BF|nr:hypothetical protein [Stenotrophomonas maltophilia]
MVSATTFFDAVAQSICSDFIVKSDRGKITHYEEHHDNTKSKFEISSNAKHVAFSLDVKGEEPFAILGPGFNTRNDFTVVCLSEEGRPLVFVVECKNSESPGDAQAQISRGIHFVEYLFDIINSVKKWQLDPRIFGVAAYRPRFPPKGTTRPKFVEVGAAKILRAEWHVGVVLPLSELIRATGVK